MFIYMLAVRFLIAAVGQRKAVPVDVVAAVAVVIVPC